ncbi:MAG: hypothetical protein HFJ59_08070 [Clostridia bacterium]|nr:hypothetical protein [Clostridia bacterium]
MEKKIYKELNKSETETTINILYKENMLSIYTNKVDLQKQLCKTLGEPTKEYIKGKSIMASRWDMSLNEKSKISKMMLKANIFEL